MPDVADIAPGQALIFSILRNNNTEFMFRLYDGEEGVIPLSVISYMGIDVQALPVVITTEQLTASLYKCTVDFPEVLISLMQKADTEFVKKLIQTRVSIDRFREFVAKIPLTETLSGTLDTKADLEYVNSALREKVDRGQVYTIDELFDVLMKFLGSKVVHDIAERDALDYAIYPFVWVIDPSDDTTPGIEAPAFYKWNLNHWVYLGSLGSFIGGGGDVDLSDYYTKEEVDSKVQEEASTRADADIAFNASLASQGAKIDALEGTATNHDERITVLENSQGSGGEVDLTPITNRLTAVEGRLTTVENTLGYVDTEVSTLLSEEFNQEV